MNIAQNMMSTEYSTTVEKVLGGTDIHWVNREFLWKYTNSILEDFDFEGGPQRLFSIELQELQMFCPHIHICTFFFHP